MDCYASQVQTGPDRAKTFLNRREFRSGLRARRRHWGELCGVVWAEAFLVGESLMREEDVTLALNDLRRLH